MKRRMYSRGSLVYHNENGQFPIYVVVSEKDGVFTLALPWNPAAAVLHNVSAVEIEPVFERRGLLRAFTRSLHSGSV